MQPMLNIALRAARSAGELIFRSIERLDVISVNEKDAKDYVTEVDRAAEQTIVAALRKAYPTHAIMGEEGGFIEGSGEGADYLWVIDPLDGTTNFIHGVPHFAVSIACKYKGRLEHAVVLDPVRQEEFTASRGRGAALNGRRLRVSGRKSLEGALLGTGFPFRDNQIDNLDNYLNMFRSLVGQTAGIRRAGAASLDLARARAGTSVAALATLAEAAQVRARVEFRYRDPQGAETLRQLDPYGLVYRNGCWYVSGFCHLRQALRSFRLDRLDAPRMLAERFERPADFDTLRHLRESFARMPRAYPVEILMRAAREQVVAVLGEPLGLLAEVDGGTLLRASTDDLDWFARRLCGLPFDFEVRQPLELREPLRRQAERVLRNLGQEEASDHR